MVCALNGNGGGVVSCNSGNGVVIFFFATVAMVLTSPAVTGPSLYAAIFLFAAATVQQTQ